MRRATADDYAVIRQRFGELATPDPFPSAADFERRMLPGVIVACEGDAVVGYAYWRIYGRIAHVVHVVAAAQVRGRGVGGTLMEAVRSAVVEEGCTRWYLNVKQHNAPAGRLYERCGMAIEQDIWLLRIGWAKVEGLEGDGAVAYAADPEEDVVIAERFGIPSERLASLRTGSGRVVLAIRERGELAGLAVFDPGLPGAVVFCAARIGLARPLLEACRAQMDLARFDFVRVVVGERAIADALVAAGAEVTFELFQMGGALG
jgi:GNAT superfamily N-acetyltransferase